MRALTVPALTTAFCRPNPRPGGVSAIGAPNRGCEMVFGFFGDCSIAGVADFSVAPPATLALLIAWEGSIAAAATGVGAAGAASVRPMTTVATRLLARAPWRA